jgi:hypothetical protein
VSDEHYMNPVTRLLYGYVREIADVQGVDLDDLLDDNEQHPAPITHVGGEIKRMVERWIESHKKRIAAHPLVAAMFKHALDSVNYRSLTHALYIDRRAQRDAAGDSL